jgi:hypothetical protein
VNPPVARDPAGRVHLAVRRDPASGAESVALTAPVFEEAWQNDIAAAAANTAHGILAGAPTLERAVALAHNAMAATSRLSDATRASASRRPRRWRSSTTCRARCRTPS